MDKSTYRYDREFTRTASRAGVSLLIFVALFYLFFYLVYFPIDSMIKANSEPPISEIISQTVHGIIYLLVFIIPALIFRLMTRGVAEYTERFFKLPPKNSPFIITATIATGGLACGYVNSILLSFFEASDTIAPELPQEPMQAYEIVLLILTTALVPAICEEFFFRHTLLSAFLPYGQGFAIFASAIFFGLMHQNIAQIFYATMAGIIFGYVYVKTRSYLCVFLIHFFNNLLSCIQQAIMANVSEPVASAITLSITASVLALGILSVIIIALQHYRQKDAHETGSFERILPPSANYKERTLTFDPSAKLFTRPTVIIFTIICFLTFVAQLIAPYLPQQ